MYLSLVVHLLENVNAFHSLDYSQVTLETLEKRGMMVTLEKFSMKQLAISLKQIDQAYDTQQHQLSIGLMYDVSLLAFMMRIIFP